MSQNKTTTDHGSALHRTHGGRHYESNKYKPISLTSTLCEVLERILLNRHIYKIGKLDAGVKGLVQQKRTADCLANYVANEKAKPSVFSDIEKAFHRAQPLIILSELTRLGIILLQER